jgi:hypothetical protein
VLAFQCFSFQFSLNTSAFKAWSLEWDLDLVGARVLMFFLSLFGIPGHLFGHWNDWIFLGFLSFSFSFGVLVVGSHKRWMHFGLRTGQLGWKSNRFEPIIFPCFLFIFRRYLNGIATRHRSTELMTLPREKTCSSETEIPLPYLEGIPPASVRSRCKQS